MAFVDVYAARARHTISKYHSKHHDILAGLPSLAEMLKKVSGCLCECPVCNCGSVRCECAIRNCSATQYGRSVCNCGDVLCECPVRNCRPTQCGPLVCDCGDVQRELPVCIIGAGAAGLYTAMILESLDIQYVLLEAGNRVGGRLFTYNGFKDAELYDYYDVGAMRFPDTPFMKRTFDLMRNRGLGIKLIDYIFTEKNDHNYYPFNPKGYVPDPYIKEGPDKIMKDVLEPLKAPFRAKPLDFDKALETLMELDGYSTRTYMRRTYTLGEPPIGPPYPSSVIHWCETMEDSTSSYDRALTETVLDSLAFKWIGDDPKELEWKCIDLGSQRLPEAMHDSLQHTKAIFNTKVTALAETHKGIKVTSEDASGHKSEHEYSAVISTVPLPRLSVMDLTGCTFTYAQWSAIRELRYGPATKVGIRFKEPWWERLGIIGGQSHTDLPIRTTVYPSYPPGDGSKSRVLIASYCWTQDAERLGALMNGDGTAQPELINLVMNDLARVHAINVKELWDLYTPGDYFAWDWLHDPLTMGAFAFFGPEEFSDWIYPAVTSPAARNKLFIAGEATSSCHAWVAGALDSAWRAVDQFLLINHPDKVHEMHENWGPTEYWAKGQMEDHIRLGMHHSMPDKFPLMERK